MEISLQLELKTMKTSLFYSILESKCSIVCINFLFPDWWSYKIDKLNFLGGGGGVGVSFS